MQNERNCNRTGAQIRSGYSSIENGKKGGRPKYDSEVKISLPDIDFVILTPTQYGSLIERYGYELLRKALLILEEWLKSSPEGEKYRGKNNYAHFRSDGWVINSAKITR